MSEPKAQNLSSPNKTAANMRGTPGILDDLQSEVPVEAAPLLQFIARNAGAVMLLLGLFVVAVAGAGAWQWHASRQNEEAQTNLARLLLQQRGADRVRALESFAATAPDSVRLAALMELGLAALAEKDAARAAAAFARAAALDKNGPFGVVAALAEAQTLMRDGKAAEALAILEALDGAVPDHMRVHTGSLIAAAARQAGNTERAVRAYEYLLAASRDDDADYYRFCIQQMQADAVK